MPFTPSKLKAAAEATLELASSVKPSLDTSSLSGLASNVASTLKELASNSFRLEQAQFPVPLQRP